MTTATLTLTDFLLARIAVDEDGRARALRDLAEAMRSQGHTTTADYLMSESDRVLAECEAKRLAIEAAWADHERIEGEWGMCRSREQMSAKDDNPAVVEALAAVYADHPDYREEWRP
jgi:hypothetical protein